MNDSTNPPFSQSPNTLLVAHVLYSFGIGGLEKGIATVINHGSGRFRHVIVCLGKGRGSRALVKGDAEVFELNKPAGNSPRFIRNLSVFLRRLRPDIVHTRNWGGMDGVVAARLAGLRNVVHGEHGWDVFDPFGLKLSRRYARRLLSRWVREYTCVSKEMEAWLRTRIKLGRHKKVTQIYNGIDIERFCPGDGGAVRKELGISADTFVAGTVSRLDPIKDHDTLIEAFRRFHRQVSDSLLLIVGDGPRMAELKAQAKDGVVFLGERHDVPDLLRAMDVFVLPSKNEGISNTILEAMATGLSVIATKVGGNPELVVDGVTGTLVPPGDVEALVAAIRSYADDMELRRRAGLEGRCIAEERFSIPAMVSAYEEVWSRVATGGHR